MSRDAVAGSASNPQTLNRFIYALNNPVALVDVSGFSAREGTHANSTPATTTDGLHIDLVSLIPIYGSGRQAYRDFKSGHYVWGTINTALAISDVFLVKSLVTVAGKVVVETVGKQLVREVADSAASHAIQSEIPTIGGRLPINSQFAGRVHPSGVEFTKQGFPNFGPHSVAEVEIKGLTGEIRVDSKLANDALGYPSTPDGFTWHHVEDGQTMQLVPQELHEATRHTGGAAVIRNGGIFDP